MAFSGTPFMFDAPQQPKDTSPKAEPLALEKTLQGMRDGQSIIQSDFLSLTHKLGDKGAIYGALVDIADILDRSAIARHSNSPLETSLAKLQESSVSYNEKTMRWHDDQTNLMVKGTDPRVAEAMKISEKPRTVEAEIHWGATIAGFLSDIKDDTATLIKLQKSTRKLIGRGFFGKKKESVEEGMEGNITDKKAEKNETKQTGFLKGISDHFNKRKEESGIWKWFKDNWGKLALGLFVALAPMKWFPKIWEFLKDTVWPILNDLFTWGTENPMKALGTMLIAWFAGPAGLITIVSALGGVAAGLAKAGLSKVGTGGLNLLQKATAGSHMTAAQKAMSASRAANAAKMGPRVGKSIPTKGIFGSIVEKFGKAGKWIKQLGSKFIMPLITTPAGWAILAGLAIGGLVYAYWDEIKAGLSKAFGFLTTAVDSLKEKFAAMDIKGWMLALIRKIPFVGDSIASWFEGKTKDEPKPAGPSGGITQEEADTAKKSGKMDYADFLQSEEYKSTVRKDDGTLRGENTKKAQKKYQSYLKGGGTTAPTDTGTGGIRPDAVATKRLAQYRKNPSRYKRKMKMGLEGTYGDALRSQMTDKELKRFGGGEDKHKAVKVSQADMGGVSWNKLGGRDTIEDAILTTWNQAGVSAAPTFTSGFRDKDHALSKSNPQSQHIQKTAFDLRSSDLGSNASAVWADISNKFAGMGLWGQWEKGSVNEGKRTGEHFHFQLAAKGFEGVVGKDGPRGFIAGEAGPELVKIQPLHPSQQGAALTAGQQQTANLSGGSAGGNVGINTTNVNNTTLGESTMVVGQQRPVGNPKMERLTA